MKKKLFIGTIILVLGIAALSIATPSPTQLTKRYVVKLYSGNSVVGTWEALGAGQVEGTTFVFTIGNDISPKKVRISGTWSIEEQN
jgi:hypothetical protein